jgi:di/tricarboxylate transporter
MILSPDAIITLIIVLITIILFVTEVLTIDLVAILIMAALIITGVVTPQEGVMGFSNTATITVALMFVLSAAILKTGALQILAQKVAPTFKKNYILGLTLLMLITAFVSAFINNTPIVAILIPIVIQISKTTKIYSSRLLIPLSYASIFGGTCTLVGTSTNLLVNGIAEKEGVAVMSMFTIFPIGIIMLMVGVIYMLLFGNKLLPKRDIEESLEDKFGIRDYITEIELMSNAESVGKRIMDSPLITEFKIDIIEVRRTGSKYILPPGDFILKEGDVLKVRCSVEKIKEIKDRIKVLDNSPLRIANSDTTSESTTMLEMVVASNSDFENKTLKDIDFRNRYRATPLAIKHREEIIKDDIYSTFLKSGDVILAEVKNHYIPELKKLENQKDCPYIIISEEPMSFFNKSDFYKVILVFASVILTATFNILPIMVGTLIGVAALVLMNIMKMKEVYEAIDWKVIFLLAGSLSLGTAMQNSGLDFVIGNGIIDSLGVFGPVIVLSGIYLVTSILTELISNAATAALITPIAIATANTMDVNVLPFIIAVSLAASASFMTPTGYQCNTMVYSAGQYKFVDFVKVGTGLNVLLWIVATIFVPILYPF